VEGEVGANVEPVTAERRESAAAEVHGAHPCTVQFDRPLESERTSVIGKSIEAWRKDSCEGSVSVKQRGHSDLAPT
jgi:hypothetical protein